MNLSNTCVSDYWGDEASQYVSGLNIEIDYFHFIAPSAPSALQTDVSIFYGRYLYGRDENSSKNGRRQRQQIRPRKVVDFDGTFHDLFLVT